MQYPISVSLNSTAFVRYVNLDYTAAPWPVTSVALVLTSTGTGAAATAGIQYTLDNGTTPSSLWRWINDSTIPPATSLAPSSGSLTTSYTFPVAYLQCVVTSISCAASGNTLEFKVIQGLL